jgi:hypothetical protein
MHVEVWPYGAANHAMEPGRNDTNRLAVRAGPGRGRPGTNGRVTEAMLTMTKLDIATHEKASVGE